MSEKNKCSIIIEKKKKKTRNVIFKPNVIIEDCLKPYYFRASKIGMFRL